MTTERRAPARASAGLGVLLLLPALLAGCRQFEVVGAADPCTGEQPLRAQEINSCWRNQATVLAADPVITDLSAAGRLHGEALPIRGRGLRHAVALDYSGSMYGGYQDPEPSAPPCGWRQGTGGRIPNGPYYWQLEEFAQLLAEGPLGALTGGEPVHPIAFNNEVTVLGAGTPSTWDAAAAGFPQPLPAAVKGRDAALRQLTATGSGRLPPSPWNAPFGNPGQTRLHQVLDASAALFDAYNERDGVLWIVTDNIIERAPDGASGLPWRDVRYNKRFYEALKTDPRWQVVYAWPIHQAPWLCGSTLMVYGFYYSSRQHLDENAYGDLCYGEEAKLGHQRQLEVFGRYAGTGSPAPGRPFKLKPEDMEVVRLSFAGQVVCPPVKIGLAASCRARLQIENLLNHRRVERAEIVLTNGRCDPLGLEARSLRPMRTAAPICAGRITQTLRLDEPLEPQASKTLEIAFQAPAVETVRRTLADHWQNANFERFLMIGKMSVAIRDLTTAMVIEPEALGNVYGVEALPALFRNPSTENLDTSICLVLSVSNPTFLASLLLMALVATVVLGTLVFGWLVKPGYRTVAVDGQPAPTRIRLTRLVWSPFEVFGRRAAKAKLGLGGEARVKAVPPHVIRKRGSYWEYLEDDVPHRIELLVRRKPSTRRDDAF